MSSVFFSDEEVGKIRNNAKKDPDLPVIYTGSSEGNKPISRVYEAHLILTGPKTKRDAIKWIDKAIEIAQTDGGDRDLLFQEFYGNLVKDNEQQLRELEQDLKGFNDFREEFTKTKIDSLETGLLFTDVYKALGYMENKRTVQDHLKALLNVLNLKFKGSV